MWSRSTFCESTHCVEWRKSSYSCDSANCVEVRERGGVDVRDSKDPDGPVLSFGAGSWRGFVRWIRG